MWWASRSITAAAATLSLAGAAAAQDTSTSGGSSFAIQPRGYVQFDWRSYPDWTVPTGTGRLNREPFEVRRARIGVDGGWQRLGFELSVDPQDDDGVPLKDAYAQFRFSRAVRVRVGQFKIAGSREYGRSARTIDFIERAPVAETLAAGRDLGGVVFGAVGRRLTYEGGVFRGDGNGRDSRGGTTGAARVEFALTGNLEVGGAFSAGRLQGVDTEAPNSLAGRAASGYRFFDRVYVHGLRLRSGADMDWERGPWRVTGEFLRTDEQRLEQGLDYDDLPRLVGTAWSAGLTRTFGRRRGARVRWREVEVGARIDRLRFDDSGPRTEFDSVRPRAADIRPRDVRAATVGLSWAPMRWTRVMHNVSWEHYGESRSGPEPGRSGFLWLGTRLQMSLR